MRKLIIARRCSQIFFLILFIYLLWPAASFSGVGLPVNIFFKLDPLVMFFGSLGSRMLIPGIGLSVLMVALTLIIGRFFCGWVCPLGTVIDISAAAVKDKKVPNDVANRKIRSVKFFVFGIIAVASFIGIQLLWILDPIVLAARFVSLNFIPSVAIAVDRALLFFVQRQGLYEVFFGPYQRFGDALLGAKVGYFSHAWFAFIVFIAILCASFFRRRLWCRALCPLGAFYALLSRFSLMRRKTDVCIQCGTCRDRCRMGAVREDMSYVKGECILCMDCLYDCVGHGTHFGFPAFTKGKKQISAGEAKRGISRREFLFLLISSIVALGFRYRQRFRRTEKERSFLLRPPGATNEEIFSNLCIRCGNCMKVCPTNALQPVMLQAGAAAVWTPQLVPEIGYCEYDCNLCGYVCPTGAIPKLPLSEKQKMKLGIAAVDRSRCIAWSRKEKCAICETRCPLPDKAIKLIEEVVGGKKIYKPYVDKRLCIGCGRCQHGCPVRPVRAIRVFAIDFPNQK